MFLVCVEKCQIESKQHGNTACDRVKVRTRRFLSLEANEM